MASGGLKPEVHRKKLPVLVINTYAGSLLVACASQDHPVLASFEDAGYGAKIQEANFPGLDVRHKRSQWPKKMDLRDAIVIAHPPCAAFSMMNTIGSTSVRGLEAKKFQCTVDVLEYSMRNKARAIAVESVVRTMDGARDVHDSIAKKHGYHVFRIFQNAVTFNTPQWRERFWAVFVKRSALPHLVVRHLPTVMVLRDVLEKKVSDVDPKLRVKLTDQLGILRDTFGLKVTKDLFRGKHGYGRVGQLLRNYKNQLTGERHDARELAREFGIWGKFDAQTVNSLNPLTWTPVVLQNSWWTVGGRMLSYVEYQRIMGFPDGYVWPGKSINQQRGYLSRGVCPPVAEWILDTLERNLNNQSSLLVRGRGNKGKYKPHSLVIEPGGVVNLGPKKVLWTEVVNDYLEENPV